VKITDVRATTVAVPLRRDEVWAFGRRRGVTSVLVEVATDEGVVGLGEAAGYPSARIVEAVLDASRDLVVGEDPFAIERILKKLYVVGTWHHVHASSPALGAIEMACWDIVGKACGQPLVNLFGGRVRDAVDYFGYVSGASPDELRDAAAEAIADGFSTLYLKLGAGSLADDVDRVAAVRDGAGADAAIRIDANESWSSAAAIRGIGELVRFGLELVEQPVSARNLPEMAYVRSRISPPMLANEASWTRWDQLEVIRAGAADVVSVDNQMDGGLLNLKRAAGMCEVAGLPVLKHSLGELGVATYAGAHVLASTPNALYPSQSYGTLLADDVLAGMSTLPYQAGRLAVPSGPGIGVELDRDKVDRYAELYLASAADFEFRDPAALAPTPLMPKR
jgi:L-alanine-DL-glutamate epimerase-like enolase superfamily enzyme